MNLFPHSTASIATTNKVSFSPNSLFLVMNIDVTAAEMKKGAKMMQRITEISSTLHKRPSE